jgi:tetratricopeptide (TPR) repeat protein
MRRTLIPLLALFLGTITLAATSGKEVSPLLEKADRLDDSDHFAEALAILKEAEKSDPSNPEILFRISRVESDLIDDLKDESQKKAYAHESVAYAKKAIELAPNSSDAHLAASIAYGKLTDYVDNRTKMEYSRILKNEAEKAVELDPKSDDGYLILARWNFEMTELNPILKGIAQMLYGEIPPASQEKALEYFKKAIAIAPNRIIHHFYYGQALAKLGRKDEAKAEYEKVISLPAADKEDRGYQRDASNTLKALR